MAFLFGDSFDHYATADITTKWTTSVDSAGSKISIGSNNGRTKNGLQIQCSNLQTACVKYTTGAKSTFFVGFAFKTTALTGLEICSFYDNSTQQLSLRLNADGTLAFYNGSNTQIAASATALSTGTFYYIEVKAKFLSSISSGDVLVKINQVTALTLSAGVSTKQSANTTATLVAIGQSQGFSNSGATFTFDDLYICDDSGSLCNTFLGDITADACFATANGNYQDFTLVGAATSVLCVGEHAPDGDSTYVKSNALTNRESFTYTSTSFSITTVFAVQTVASVKKVGTGTRNVTPFTRIGITNYESTAITLSTSYGYAISVYMTNPSSGVAWISSDISSLEAGVKVS